VRLVAVSIDAEAFDSSSYDGQLLRAEHHCFVAPQTKGYRLELEAHDRVGR
jgi:hypothetical protein